MYKFVNVLNTSTEKKLYNVMNELNAGLFSAVAESTIVYLDIQKIFSEPSCCSLKVLASWLESVSLENAVVIANVDLSAAYYTKAWEFTYELIKKNNPNVTIVLTNITEIVDSNYAQARFGYSAPFIASSMEAIKNICDFLNTGLMPKGIFNM